ncbi:MAG TPA: sortase [Candidatus Dormibacteraeota bacterium]|nr:sortase [Candidatus Dormibacteraeota bacterium]
MVRAKYRLTDKVAQPLKFNPTEKWADDSYVYLLDTERGICKKSPLNSQANLPTAYYLAEEDKPKPPPAPRPVRKSAVFAPPPPRYKTRLARGLAAAGMAVAAFLIIYPLWPGIEYELSRALNRQDSANAQLVKPDNLPVTAVNKVIIPKIKVSSAILEGPDLSILDREEGVWHQKGEAPGGNFVLAGHRFKYLPPNTSTLYNLGKLEPGDTIVIDWLGKRYVYAVSEVKTIGAGEVSILDQSLKQRITIYTCSDKQETERIVAIAEPVPY